MFIESFLLRESLRLDTFEAENYIREKYQNVIENRVESRLDSLDFIRVDQVYWRVNREDLIKSEGVDFNSEIERIDQICEAALFGYWTPMRKYLRVLAEASNDGTQNEERLKIALINLADSI